MKGCRVTIQWTETAKEGLKDLPPKVRRGLLEKIEDLYDTDPRQAHKALVGPLSHYFTLKYSRYRALYSVAEEETAKGEILIHLTVLVVAVGIRKAHDKKDIYKVAEKLIQLGLLSPEKQEDNGG